MLSNFNLRKKHFKRSTFSKLVKRKGQNSLDKIFLRYRIQNAIVKGGIKTKKDADNEGEMIVKRIKQGTVIDHIPGGAALLVLKVLGIKFGTEEKVTVAMNAESEILGAKDIVKIFGRKLKIEETNKIALFAPEATINIIENFKVVDKSSIKPPEVVRGLMKCLNPTCISNDPLDGKGVVPTVVLSDKKPILYKCYFCDHPIKKEQIEACLLI